MSYRENRKLQELEKALEKARGKIAAYEEDELGALKKEHGILNKRNLSLASLIREKEGKIRKVEQKEIAIEERRRKQEAEIIELEKRDEKIKKMKEGELSRLEIVQMMPNENDSQQLKTAWYYLLNALTANGNSMEKWDPPPPYRR